jgi:hypothetical protein
MKIHLLTMINLHQLSIFPDELEHQQLYLHHIHRYFCNCNLKLTSEQLQVHLAAINSLNFLQSHSVVLCI